MQVGVYGLGVPRFSQGMSEWITDRPPTEADSEAHELAPAPTAKPLLPHFKVGQVWRMRNGTQRIIRVVQDEITTKSNYLICSVPPDRRTRHWHSLDGRSILGQNRDHSCDLVELIAEASETEAKPVDAEFDPEAAEPAAIELPQPIRAGVTPFYVLVVSDDAGGRGNDGKAIVWETAIPNGSSLQAVLEQQARIGNRYGTTFVAECRIIPELSRHAA